MKRIKEKSLKFMEIRDPAQSVGLWSYWGEYETTLTPMPPTKEAFGKFINGDIARPFPLAGIEVAVDFRHGGMIYFM